MKRVTITKFHVHKDGPFRVFLCDGYLDSQDRPFQFMLAGRRGTTWTNIERTRMEPADLFTPKEEKIISQAIWRADNS